MGFPAAEQSPVGTISDLVSIPSRGLWVFPLESNQGFYH